MVASDKFSKDTLWHIEWGDGDSFFVVAPDKKTAREQMPDGKDMVNSITKLDALYQMIFQAGIKEVVEWIEANSETFETHSGKVIEFNLRKAEWQSKLKEWGMK